MWDLPTTSAGSDRTREFDLDRLYDLFTRLSRYAKMAVGIEWPSTRPGEGAERCERFGRGKGLLQAFAYCHRLDYYLIVPSLWKGRLGLPGKQHADAVRLAAALFDRYYPQHRGLIRGPRGGLLSGRIDALLIAHFLRMRTRAGMQATVDRFGKGSPEAMATVLKGGRGRRRPKAGRGDIPF